jgi:hypothetical protein
MTRTAITALSVLASCLLTVATVEAAPARRWNAHSRARCAVSHKTVSPRQAFAKIATRRPDRRVYKHGWTLVRRARTSGHPLGGDAVIQTDAPTVLLADCRPAPALQPLGILVLTQTQILSHDGLIRRSPRGPPASS